MKSYDILIFKLPDPLFEDLAMDVFDEVERRELNTSTIKYNDFDCFLKLPLV